MYEITKGSGERKLGSGFQQSRHKQEIGDAREAELSKDRASGAEQRRIKLVKLEFESREPNDKMASMSGRKRVASPMAEADVTRHVPARLARCTTTGVWQKKLKTQESFYIIYESGQNFPELWGQREGQKREDFLKVANFDGPYMYSSRENSGATGKRGNREIGNSDQLCKFIPFGHNSMGYITLTASVQAVQLRDAFFTVRRIH
ncbi:hypothetical protein GGX14DRAFT_400720 [Mycena pura]|uniref:Uncharacterized protein n=1 Tax=Mycena pura TaxID=153505 RepID=A0AAD6V2E3_9AGAR|nr:hypothetical protein GGX14DRAFT_400720 [Mycena pura]